MPSKRLLDGGGVVGFLCSNHPLEAPSAPRCGLFVELSFISFHQLVQPLHLVVLGLKKQISNPVSSPTGLYKHLESCLKLSNLAMPLHSLSVLSSWSIAAVCLVAHAGIQQRKGRLTLHLEASNQQSCHIKLHTQLLLGWVVLVIGMYWATLLLSAKKKKKQPSSSCYLLHTSIP